MPIEYQALWATIAVTSLAPAMWLVSEVLAFIRRVGEDAEWH